MCVIVGVSVFLPALIDSWMVALVSKYYSVVNFWFAMSRWIERGSTERKHSKQFIGQIQFDQIQNRFSFISDFADAARIRVKWKKGANEMMSTIGLNSNQNHNSLFFSQFSFARAKMVPNEKRTRFVPRWLWMLGRRVNLYLMWLFFVFLPLSIDWKR